MPSDAGSGDPPAITADVAFAALGNETRIEVLRVLAEAGEPLRFSEIRDRAGLRQGGQLQYHLERLVDHFVVKADDGYRLSHSGRRVVEAVLSGVVTDSPTIQRTDIDWPCERCGAPVEISYDQERVERYCTECPGTYSQPTRPAQAPESGYLGALSLPPAGVQGRTPRQIQRAATLWGQLEFLTAVGGICPTCSATVSTALDVCDDHDASEGQCEVCGSHYAVWKNITCTNCIYELRSSIGGLLAVSPALLTFLGEHGLSPFNPTARYPSVVWSPTEEVISTDPFQAEYTFEVDGESITLTVDEDLRVVDEVRI